MLLVGVLLALGLVSVLVSGGCGAAASLRPGADPLRGDRLYVDPHSPAARQAAAWRAAGDRADATAIEAIAAEPTATWLTGSAGATATTGQLLAAAGRTGSVPVLVLYDIPARDCGGYSSGGAASAGAYLQWVGAIAKVIAGRPAIVIVEPDAVDQAAEGCVSPAGATARYALLRAAVAILKSRPHVSVYLDAGNAGWLPWSRIVDPLRRAGVLQADGFALNVANFQTTAASIAYGRALSQRLGGRHFVIDTSRNGSGPPAAREGIGSYCNPPGRTLGRRPTTDTGERGVDAYLWIKYPGASDGACRPGEPPAGVWWPSYALALTGVGNR